VGRAEGEKGGDELRLTDELREQRLDSAEVEVVKRDKRGLRPVQLKKMKKC